MPYYKISTKKTVLLVKVQCCGYAIINVNSVLGSAFK